MRALSLGPPFMTRIDDPSHDHEAGSADATLDSTRTDDTRIRAVRPLISPALLFDELPVSELSLALVEQTRRDIGAVLRGS
jgi:3-deoxy-7-phosphoheptulonate synthase